MPEERPQPSTPRAKRRWYRPTPGRGLVVLFLVEAILWLSDRWCWFPFNKHPGWTVLIAIAVMLAALAGMVLWFVASLIFRWRFQFGTRFLLATVAMVAMLCSWLATEVKAAREQWATQMALENHHITCYSDSYELDEGLPEALDTWLLNLFDVNILVHVDHVEASGDEGLECLTGLPYLRKLELVYAEDAEITDNGLKATANLTHLEELTVNSDDITDDGLKHLEGLTSLRELSICSSAITDAGLRHLSGLEALQRLSFECPRVRGPGLQYIGRLKQLREVSFGYGSSIGDVGLENLKGLRHLKSLQLAYAKIDDAGLVYLEGMHELEDLDICGCRISDAGLLHLKRLTQLRSLDLSSTGITDSGLESLERLTQLEGLYLADTKITDTGIEHLKPLQQLQELWLNRTGVTKQGRKGLRHSLPNCAIDLDSPVGITSGTRSKKE
jgi:hypothetical protein